MFHMNNLHRILHYSFVFLLIFFSLVFCSGEKVYAAINIDHYAYKNIKNNLPDDYKKDQYLYNSGNYAYISFATYNGNDYKTSVKRTEGQNDYLYCMDYSKHIDFGKEYSVKNTLFNNTLRARLAIAYYYGASTWKGLANSQFSTGNTILDYYMTQLVIHALIYEYGGDKANYGIDYSKIAYKDNTATLKKCTDAFLKHCRNATIYAETADFTKFKFNFLPPDTYDMYLSGDVITTPSINCQIDANNSTVNTFARSVSGTGIAPEAISLEHDASRYDSACRMYLPVSGIEGLAPGYYIVTLSETVNFNRYLAGAWQSTDASHASQEIGGLLPGISSASDSISFGFLVGNVILRKKDSITGENIPDATFSLQQYDNTTGQYVYYKPLTYNAATKQYESGNIYKSANNTNGLFRIVEDAPGNHYINDWDGTYFQLTNATCAFEFDVENAPILGKLSIRKTGEKLSFSDSQFTMEKDLPLSGVKFGLYAKENITLKDKIFYSKDKKIADLITDSSGHIEVNDLLPGEYYFKEEETHPLYTIDPQSCSFTIKKDKSGEYNTADFELKNHLKPCNLQIFKYYYDDMDHKQEKKLPLQGARFGLYAAADIKNANGEIVLAKDSLIKEAVSDANGAIQFKDLPYCDYYLKELEAPEGYIINDGIVEISKDEFWYKQETKSFFAEKEILNEKQNFIIRIRKNGETFSGARSNTTDYGEYIAYELQQQSLSNVEFSLYRKEDNTFISKAVTDANGVAEFKDVKSGNYYVMETAAPEAYRMNADKIYFECGIESSRYNPLKPPVLEASMDNELCNCQLTLSKVGEQAKVVDRQLIYEQVPLDGIVFGIYQGFEYTFPAGEKLAADTCVGYLVTDVNGVGSLTTKLPVGNYYVKELKTNAGYDIDPNTYPFEIAANKNQDITIRTDQGTPFINQLSKSSVKIIKTDANTGKRLKGVEFTLYNDEDEPIGTYKTDKKGIILVDNLPYGKYYFIETKCRNGYYSSNDKYRFELVSGDTRILNITNNPMLQLGFSEYYKEGIVLCFILIVGLFRILYGRHGLILKRLKKKSH